MAHVSFQVIDGVDKGRTFVNLETPVTIGREEGNAVRLNDDRVSRFHAKVQEDQGHVVLTDLDSTNGTRINGETVQLRLLRPGDRVNLGRSTLIFGTVQEIASSVKGHLTEQRSDATGSQAAGADSFVGMGTDISASEVDFDVSAGEVNVFDRIPPELPARMSPAQAAQLSEVIDFLHQTLAEATAPVHIPPKATEARLPLAQWQQMQLVLGFLASYSRSVSDPDGRPTRDGD